MWKFGHSWKCSVMYCILPQVERKDIWRMLGGNKMPVLYPLCTAQIDWARWPLKVPSNPKHSVILWFSSHFALQKCIAMKRLTWAINKVTQFSPIFFFPVQKDFDSMLQLIIGMQLITGMIPTNFKHKMQFWIWSRTTYFDFSCPAGKSRFFF